MRKADLIRRIYYKILPPESVEEIRSTIGYQWCLSSNLKWGQFILVPMTNGKKGLFRISAVYPPLVEYEFYYYLRK